MVPLLCTAPSNRCNRSHVCDSRLEVKPRACDRLLPSDRPTQNPQFVAFGVPKQSKSTAAWLCDRQTTRVHRVPGSDARAGVGWSVQSVSRLVLRIAAIVL